MNMRKVFGRFAFAFACLIAFTSLNVNKVSAAHATYTVTFRPGDVGRFALSSDSLSSDLKADAQAVAEAEYSGYTYSVTDNGAIKVEVPNGQTISAPTYVVPEDNYFVISDWYKDSATAVTKNADYVVDYGRLTDGVEYTVRYVIAGTDTSIRPLYSTKGNVGDTVSITAPSVVVVSTATRYFLSGATSQSISLDADSSKNVISFEYTIEPSPVTEEEVVTVVGGGTVTTVVPGAAGVAAAPAAQAAAAGAAPAAVAPEAAQAATEETTTIEDAGTALASGAGTEEGEDLTNIAESETPLASAESSFISSPLFIALAAVVIAAAAVAFYLVRKNKAKQVADEQDKEEK